MAKLKFLRTLYIIYFILAFPLPTYSGLDRFTKLVEIEKWLIERRVDSVDYNIRCRASIPGNSSWYGGRIHLDESGDLIIPKDIIDNRIVDQLVVEQVRSELKNCKKGFIYKSY